MVPDRLGYRTDCNVRGCPFSCIGRPTARQIFSYTVRKNDIILRSIERMLETQLSMARKFPLWRLRRYSIKYSKVRKFTFNAPWPEETEEHKLGANQHPMDL